MAFAPMKRIVKLDRLRLRGLSGARDEVLLTAPAQNHRTEPPQAGEVRQQIAANPKTRLNSSIRPKKTTTTYPAPALAGSGKKSVRSYYMRTS